MGAGKNKSLVTQSVLVSRSQTAIFSFILGPSIKEKIAVWLRETSQYRSASAPQENRGAIIFGNQLVWHSQPVGLERAPKAR